MGEIKLSKDEKKVLRLLNTYDSEALDIIARSQVRRALRSHEKQHFVRVAWIEGGDYEAVCLTRDGKDYLIENPKLRNPVNWHWIIGVAIGIASLAVSILILCIACSKFR